MGHNCVQISRRIRVVFTVAGLGLAVGGLAAAQAMAIGRAPVARATSFRAEIQSPIQRVAHALGGAHQGLSEASNVRCGESLSASVTLNGELDCDSGPALIITKNSINLNLNGFNVFGGGTAGVGVQVKGTSDTVQNGVVAGFTTAIVVTGTTDVVTKLRLTNNATGILDLGTKTKITSNSASANQNGITLAGVSTAVTGNRVASNFRAGIDVTGANVVVSGNFATSNNVGIVDQGVDTTLTGNTTDFNSFNGIQSNEAEGAAIDGGGNYARGNDWATGSPGAPSQCQNIVCVSH